MAPRGFRARAGTTPCVIMLAVLLAGCTISVGDEPPGSPIGPSTGSPVEAPADPPQAASSSGRLAIVGRDGGLSTSLPDGSDLVVLVPGGGDETAAQPSWSPGGRLLAWVSSDPSAGPDGGSIVIAGPRGEDPRVTPTPFVPYYLGWDPTGSRVAFLGSRGDPEVPVEMGILTVGDTQQPDAIAGGSPFFYFAWGPDGDRVVAHAGVNRLEEIDLSGRTSRPIAKPGAFSAPSWSTDGRVFAYVARGSAGIQRLMVRTGDAPPRSVAQGQGVFSFLLSPDGEALAYQLLGADEGPTLADTLTPSGGIWVLDLASGLLEQATETPAMTFSWSPDGTGLLALSPVAGSGRIPPFSWQVWNGRTTATVEGVHAPTLEYFRSYAPFFTQYAQNTTPWSPEGDAFAYAAEAPDGLGQIVVQQVEGDAVVVAPGIFVTWSPTHEGQ